MEVDVIRGPGALLIVVLTQADALSGGVGCMKGLVGPNQLTPAFAFSVASDLLFYDPATILVQDSCARRHRR